ncbi:SRPBCC family protein [Sporosarcina sp. CAU 1771]
MPTIQHEIFIAAPIELCFDLARTVEVHAGRQLLTVQKAISGVTAGIMENGDFVTWETSHFGIKQNLTSKIIEMEKPFTFTDRMLEGAFHSFTHTHEFIENDGGTMMKDTFSYTSPFGVFGQFADRLFLENYMGSFISEQAKNVKWYAEITL